MMTRKLMSLVMVAGLTLGAFGCQKKDKAADEGKAKDEMKADVMADDMKADDMKPEEMKADDMKAEEAKPAAKSNEDKFIGDWTADFEKMKTSDPDIKKASPADQQKMAEMFAKMSVKVGKGTLEMTMPGEKEDKGTWTVKSQEGAKMVIESKDGKGKVTVETIEFTDDDHVVLGKEGDKEKIYLMRKK